MEQSYTLLNFVPFYIFVPMVLIGVIELMLTPTPSSSPSSASSASAPGAQRAYPTERIRDPWPPSSANRAASGVMTDPIRLQR